MERPSATLERPAEPPADDARPTADDIEPVANETLDRVITGIVTAVPFLALGAICWQVWATCSTGATSPCSGSCTCRPGSG